MNNRMILSGLVAVAALATPMIASAATAAPKTAAVKHHKAKPVKVTKKTETTTAATPAAK